MKVYELIQKLCENAPNDEVIIRVGGKCDRFMEYIEDSQNSGQRVESMRLIDADALTDELIRESEADTSKSIQTSFAKSVCLLLCKALELQQTVDAVPVIRCKDCRYYEVYERKYDGSADKRFKPSICTRAYEYAVTKAPNWFCADAEPKEAE